MHAQHSYQQVNGKDIRVSRQIKIEAAAATLREYKDRNIPLTEVVIENACNQHGLHYDTMTYSEISYLNHLVDYPLEKIKNF